jgi:hypothetical protein
LLIGLMLTSAMRPAAPVVAPVGQPPHGSNFWDVLVTGAASAASILGAYWGHSGGAAGSAGVGTGSGGTPLPNGWIL